MLNADIRETSRKILERFSPTNMLSGKSVRSTKLCLFCILTFVRATLKRFFFLIFQSLRIKNEIQTPKKLNGSRQVGAENQKIEKKVT